jgi:hypothetical protein
MSSAPSELCDFGLLPELNHIILQYLPCPILKEMNEFLRSKNSIKRNHWIRTLYAVDSPYIILDYEKSTLKITPIGDDTIELTIIHISTKDICQEECITFQIKKMSPLMLVYALLGVNENLINRPAFENWKMFVFTFFDWKKKQQNMEDLPLPAFDNKILSSIKSWYDFEECGFSFKIFEIFDKFQTFNEECFEY